MKDGEDIALYAISVDLAEKSNALILKIAKDGMGGIGFPLLSDPNSSTINDYGLFDSRYMGSGDEGIPQPAIFVLDKDRKVFWAHIDSNYRVRPTVEEIRTQIDKLKGMPDIDNKKISS